MTRRRKIKKKIDSIWYNGTEGFKKTGVDISQHLTPERIHELQRCAFDCHYFIENYCKIRTVDPHPITKSRINPFILRDYQKEQVNLYLNNRFVALSYPRQSGKTAGTVAYFAWKLMFTSNFTIMCLANKDSVARDILEKVKLIIKELPVWMSEGVVKLNDHELKLENGSSIVAKATTLDAGRSASANIVYIDEAAFIARNTWLEFYKGVYPTISSGDTTQVIMTSTPNGLNHWWTICDEANKVAPDGSIDVKGYSEFMLKEIKWYQVPIGFSGRYRDEEYKKKTISNIGQAAWDSEYECKFLGSAGTLLVTEILERLKHMRKRPIREEKIADTDVKVSIFKEPRSDRSYVVTHDASEGLGEPDTGSQADENGNNDPDYTGIHVWDVTDLDDIEQVARIYDRTIVEDDAPYIIKRLCQKYNNAFEISENNMLPSIPKTIFKDLDYERVYKHTDGRWGIKMTQSTRNKGLGIMKSFFRKNRFKIYDEDTIYELSNFVNKNGKYQAADGKHDDLVTSMNLLCWFLSDKNRYKTYFNDEGNFMKDIHKRNVEDEEFCMFVDDGIGDVDDWVNYIPIECRDKYLPPSD